MPKYFLALLLLGCTTANFAYDDKPIGTAYMQPDGTIILDLIAQNDDGALGNARLIIPIDDPNHAKILQHIGDIRPGEQKPVPPFPGDGPISLKR